MTAAVPDPRFRDQPTREDRAVAAGLVRRARAAMSDDERDTVVDAISREIASERAAARAEVEARVQAAAKQRAVEAEKALRLIDRYGCEHYTRGRCLDPTSSKTRGAQNGADAWCAPCVAAAALASPVPETEADRG